MPKRKTEEQVTAVEERLHRNGDYPADELIVIAAELIVIAALHYTAQWAVKRCRGMDVLASHELDKAIEMLQAAREL